MARQKRRQSITLERGEDGTYRMGKDGFSEYGRSPKDMERIRRILDVQNPPSTVSLAYPALYPEHLPPVPGSIGRWRGKGTRTDPYHWVGVSEKLAAYTALAVILVWGAEVLETDLSNWWSNSALNVGNDLTNLSDDVLNALGFPVTKDSSGKTTAVGTRQHATFFSWLLNQVMVQGGDLEQAVSTVNGLSTGFPSGSGLSSPPPAAPVSGLSEEPPGWHHQKGM